MQRSLWKWPVRAFYLLLLTGWFAPSFEIRAQLPFTPYDNLPGVIRSYKPAWSEDLPDWADDLYRYPIDPGKLEKAFRDYTRQHPQERSAIIRYYKMWRRAIDSYISEDGIIRIPEGDQTDTDLKDTGGGSPFTATDNPANGSQWIFTGPKETFWLNESGSPAAPAACPWQVNVYSFDVAESFPDILFCGTETGFVNKSNNRGLTWQPAGIDYYFGGSVTAVAIHPFNPDIIYVAAGNQVHRSLDGGLDWTPLLMAGNQFNADRLKIDPGNPQKLLAASSNGLYLSTDGGVSWSRKWNSPCWDAEFHPGNPMKVSALTRNGSVFSVIQSTDGGQTFLMESAFPNNIPEISGGLLAMTPANPNMLLAILLSSNNTPYLLKGLFSGSSWTWSLLATGGSSSFPMDNGQGYFDLVLDISPVNANLILTGTTTLYKSVNGGVTFTPVGGYAGNFSIHPDIQDIKMLANGDTWVSTDGGMNLTTDNFGLQANYTARVNGLTGSDFWGFDQGWNEDLCVGGRYHNGNTAIAGFYQPKSLRMGGAESPTGWILQGKSRHAAFDDLGNGWILPQTAEGKPEGRFIFSKYPNMDEYGGRRGNLVHHPLYYGQLYLGEGTGFWRSSDMGVTWDLLYDFPARVRYLQISYHNPEVIYADINGAGLVKSNDGGLTWEQKPSLTSPPYGNSNWKGKLFFAISPQDENILYACLQNGTWSADIGKVFRSADGGETWEDWTGTLSEYMKCMVVQPSATGGDLVYLFTNARNNKQAGVYYRSAGMADWQPYQNDYPAGMSVNMAYPFFRDAKLRVGGNCGVWESPMKDTIFPPVVTPWVGKAHYDCMLDTIQFDDHSIVRHSGTAWHWSIDPAPVWIDNPDIRNPSVVFGNPGSYDVTLTIVRDGQSYSRTVNAMVTVSECPSIYNCDNPADLPKDLWWLVYADSEEIHDPGLAVMSFDGDPSTIWHTRWSTGTDPYPHEIRIALGQRYRVSKFTLLNRQDGENGRIRQYRLYISTDTTQWGEPVSEGEFLNTAAPQTVTFDTVHTGSYFRLVALSEVNGGPWASVAEFSLTGCVDWPVSDGNLIPPADVTAFPVPTDGNIRINLPSEGNYTFQVWSAGGEMVRKGILDDITDGAMLNLAGLPSGSYLIVIRGNNGTTYRVKVIRT